MSKKKPKSKRIYLRKALKLELIGYRNRISLLNKNLTKPNIKAYVDKILTKY